MPMLIFGFCSFYFRKMTITSKQMHELDTSISTLSGIFNDATFAFLGYTFGSLYSFMWNYHARKYVRERLRFEKDIQFSRK